MPAPAGPRQILLASPREPSGNSWLVNALLELGVRVNFKPAIDRVWRSVRQMRHPSAMWRLAPGGGWQLHPRADALRKWLPAVSRRESLHFRDDVAVFYVQDLPRAEFQGAPSVLFVRDPRDAIASLYRRLRPQMTLAEYAAFPHPETLLDAVAHWRLFVESWLARDGVRVYRFEDYKDDAVALLGRIVADLGIAATPAEIASAAFESSYEKAREAEQRYRAEHPGDDEVAMRAGRVGEWTEAGASTLLAREIEARCASLLARLGYAHDAPAAAGPAVDGVSVLRTLAVFDEIELPPGWREAAAAADPAACPQLPGLRELAAAIDTTAMDRARLPAREGRQLLQSLGDFAQVWQPDQQPRLAALRTHLEDGSAYQFSRIRELAQRVRTGPGPAAVRAVPEGE